MADNMKLATEEYVDTGLTSKVDKEEGKGLSTNDFTNDYKTKLDGIQTGAVQTPMDIYTDPEHFITVKFLTAKEEENNG